MRPTFHVTFCTTLTLAVAFLGMGSSYAQTPAWGLSMHGNVATGLTLRAHAWEGLKAQPNDFFGSAPDVQNDKEPLHATPVMLDNQGSTSFGLTIHPAHHELPMPLHSSWMLWPSEVLTLESQADSSTFLRIGFLAR